MSVITRSSSRSWQWQAWFHAFMSQTSTVHSNMCSAGSQRRENMLVAPLYFRIEQFSGRIVRSLFKPLWKIWYQNNQKMVSHTETNFLGWYGWEHFHHDRSCMKRSIFLWHRSYVTMYIQSVIWNPLVWKYRQYRHIGNHQYRRIGISAKMAYRHALKILRPISSTNLHCLPQRTSACDDYVYPSMFLYPWLPFYTINYSNMTNYSNSLCPV